MLDWLWPQLTDDEVRLLHECIDAFAQPTPNAQQLRDLATRVAELEKRYVQLNPAQHPTEALLGRILVCTVGMRPLPVILSVLLLQPTKLYLLHSNESRRSAEQIRDDPYVQGLGLHPTNDIVLRTISLTDAPENYGHLQRIVNENPNRQLVIDISGGVKVMGVSLAAAAFWLRIPVVYQLGEEVAQTIRPFSEQLTELQNPFIYFGSTELRAIQDLFRIGDYDAALAICHNLRTTVGDVQTLGKLDVLEEFVRVYRDWDAYAHSPLADNSTRRLATRLRVVTGRMKRLGLSFADPNQVQENLAILSTIEDSWQPEQRNNSDTNRLADIYACSMRRGNAGKYDDAVARLYRCLEMAATICLVRDCAVNDVDKPNLSWLEERYGGAEGLAGAFQKAAGFLLGSRRLGLKDQMVLLSLSGDKRHKQIAAIFTGLEKSGLMEARNRSILAHGTVPVREEEYRQIDQKTKDIISFVFPDKLDLDALLRQATHPEIRIEL